MPPKPHELLGKLLAGRGQWEKAKGEYREAIRLDPKNAAYYHFRLGMALHDKGQLDEAIASYKKAIELNPKYALPHNNLSWLLATCSEAKFRDPARAVELAKKAVALRPKDGTMWNTLGAAHYRAGNWKEAVAALEKSMELLRNKGGDISGWFFLAMAHWQLGEKEKARDWYSTAEKWMDQIQPKNEALRRFRAEAAELLKIEAKKK
jgi:superkiller protein 3